MGLFGSSSRNRTSVSTNTTTQIRDIGFTGQQGVDLATNLAIVGAETSTELADRGVVVGVNAISTGGAVGSDLARTGGIVGVETSRVGGAVAIELARSGRDVGTAGRDVALAGAEVALGNLETTEVVSGRAFDSVKEGFGVVNQLASTDSNNLRTVVQSQSEGFNRLVGGASELVKNSGEIASDLLGESIDVSRTQLAEGQRFVSESRDAGTEQFTRIVDAARGLAGDITQGAEAFVRGATDTVERLGPQTKQNQNIAFAGIGVAALAIGFLVFANRRK